MHFSVSVNLVVNVAILCDYVTLMMCVRFAMNFVIQIFVCMKLKYPCLVHFDQCLVTRQILTRSSELLHFFVLFLFLFLIC